MLAASNFLERPSSYNKKGINEIIILHRQSHFQI